MTKLQKRLLTILGGMLFLASFILMVYYGKETFYVESEASLEHEYDYHIVLITEEVGNDYWRMVEKGAKEEANKHNIYLEYIGPSKSDNDEKLQTLDRMIAANVDGIITQGIPGQRFIQLVKKATDHGIPVITIDTDVPESHRKVYVGTDNYRAGYLAGQTLVRNTSGEQYVGVVVGMFEALNQQARLKGFEDAISASERIKLVNVEESNITEIGAAQATYSLLKMHPELTALFGTSALDGVGIVQGVEEMNPSQDLYIIGFDTLPQTLALIEQEKMDATIIQYPSEMGQLSVELMMKIKNNEAVESLNYTETGVIYKDDVKNGEMILHGGAS